jgi:hypothetical protein
LVYPLKHTLDFFMSFVHMKKLNKALSIG